MFGGEITDNECWGNHFPAPPFYYYVDECYINGFDFDGLQSVYVRGKGEYIHSIVPAFGHWTTAKAEGTPTVNRATCEGGSLPPGPSDLECELDSEQLE